MTKTIKMSLAAVVAVAGIASTASAVDYKGKVYVENHATTVGDAQTVTGYEIDFDVTAKAKINDNFTAVVGVEADTDQKDDAKVERASVNLDETYIAYSGNGLGVKMGRMNISTPTTDGEDGEGIMASYTMGGITAVAAHFGNNAVASKVSAEGADASAIAVLGAAGPVNFEAWQVSVSGHSDHTTLAASGAVEGIKLGARVATTSYDAAGTKDGDTTIVSVAGKAGNVALSLDYVMTGEDGAAYTTDASSKNTKEMVKLSPSNKADTTAMILAASMPIADGYSASLKYGTMDEGDKDGVAEVVLQLNKKFAKNLKGSLRYSDYDEGDGTQTMRADLTYKF